MSALCEYFASSTDDAAATVIDLDGGPSHTPSPAVLGTVSGDGIDPSVQMGTLEELLTGRSVDDVMTDARWAHALADQDDYERVIFTLTDTLIEALADVADDKLTSVADS